MVKSNRCGVLFLQCLAVAIRHVDVLIITLAHISVDIEAWQNTTSPSLCTGPTHEFQQFI